VQEAGKNEGGTVCVLNFGYILHKILTLMTEKIIRDYIKMNRGVVRV
jgi:hypothetical protein